MLISLMVLALTVMDEPQSVIATARAAVAPPVAVEAPVDVAPSVLQTTLDTATPHNLTTDQQIARWIDQRQPGEPAFDKPVGPADDRRLHGEVSAGIGTGGYRDVGMWVSIPLGDSGRLDLSFDHMENGLFPYSRDPRGMDRFYRDPDGPFRVRDAATRSDAWDERIRRHRAPAHPPTALEQD